MSTATISFTKDELTMVYTILKPSEHGEDLVMKFGSVLRDAFLAKNAPDSLDMVLGEDELWKIQEAVSVSATTKNQLDAGLQVHLKVIGALIELKAAVEVEDFEQEVERGLRSTRKGKAKRRAKGGTSTPL